MKEEMFKSKRWTEYQDVKVLNIKVKPTVEDKKKAEEFRKFVDKKTEKEQGTQK